MAISHKVRSLGTPGEDDPLVECRGSTVAAAASSDPHGIGNAFDHIAQSHRLVSDESRQLHMVRRGLGILGFFVVSHGDHHAHKPATTFDTPPKHRAAAELLWFVSGKALR